MIAFYLVFKEIDPTAIKLCSTATRFRLHVCEVTIWLVYINLVIGWLMY